MGEYYLDIETFSPHEKPDPLKDKIVAIAYQRLSTRDGSPEGKLEILTEWGFGSERSMLAAFKSVLLTGNDFDFVPIGVNLYGSDLLALIHRLNRHFRLQLGMEFFRSRPVVDIKSVLVMINRGSFSRYEHLLGKESDGAQVREWYESKRYSKITKYVKQEAANLVRVYRILKRTMPQISVPKTLHSLT